MRETSRYTVPKALGVDQTIYIRWLRRKAKAHLDRDRKRVTHEITGEEYRRLIHAAVCDHGTHDFYTGEALNWSLISSYDNKKSAEGRSRYKASFALLPTVDHISGENGRYDFVICGWRTNDAKNDLAYEEFLDLCRRVVAKADGG